MQPADLPAGWTSEPYQAAPGDTAAQAAFARCVGGRDTTPDQVSEQHSPDFPDPSGTGMSSSATSFRSQQDITDDVALLTGPKTAACHEAQMKAYLATALPPGAKRGDGFSLGQPVPATLFQQLTTAVATRTAAL